MNKIFKALLILLLIIPLSNINAIEINTKGYINKQGVLFYSEPNFAGKKMLDTLDTGDEITILDNNLVESTDKNRCASGFYKINFYWESYNKKNYEGYVCSDDINFQIDTEQFEQEFKDAGIPESYFQKLTLLKKSHPNWKFTAFQTNLDFEDVVNAESVVGMNYIQVTNLETGAKYISLDEGSYDPIAKQYIVREGTNWYAANRSVVEYYLDPRNFLNETDIFMFENLGYNPSYQTLEAVQNILNNTDLYNYSNSYIEAATYKGNNISPVFLAASSKQEVVKGDGHLSDSANGNGKINDVSMYNVYNLGAFSSCENPVLCAINFASGYEGTRTSYERPWTTIEASIKNGAQYIGEGYINQNQKTLYFKKFNVTGNIYGNYSNQYMTNVKGALSEANSTYSGYSKMSGILDSTIEFIIPVYKNMPNSSSLPNSVDTNKKQELENEAQKTESKNVASIVNGSGYAFSNEFISNIAINSNAGGIINNLKNNGATEVSITTNDGTSTKYLSEADKLGTGDILTIKSGSETRTLRIVIYGDANGDGKVSAVDYVKIKNYIMSSDSLNGSYKIAADVNKDGVVSAVDYVNIKNYIMGNSSVLK